MKLVRQISEKKAEFQCECGKSVIRTVATLDATCGHCNSKLRHVPGDAESRKRYAHYQRDAKKRGFAFDLSYTETFALLGQDCHYCNHSGKVGIDRKNPEEGYTLENCLPACWPCNKMKGTMPYLDFIRLVKRIAKHIK